MRDVIIRRQRRREAEQAVKDLIDRGYIEIFPLTEFRRDGKIFDRDAFNRQVFRENTFSSCWIAKMRKSEVVQ